MSANEKQFKHGLNGYSRHRCRCEVCAEAKRAANSTPQARAARAEWRERNRGKVREIARRYQAKSHRANPDAYNQRVKASNAKKLLALQADTEHPDHGKNGSYTAGCRCADCTRARREYERVRRAKKAGVT